MKKSCKTIIVELPAVFLVMLFLGTLLFGFDGCANKISREDSFFEISQMPKMYVGDIDKKDYGSLASFEKEIFQNKKKQGGVVMLVCIENKHYITISHNGEDVVVTGKTVAKCRVEDVGEVFNGFEAKEGSVVEFEQQYYLLPQDSEDTLKILESLGAELQYDLSGNASRIEMEDGDYELPYDEGIDFRIKIWEDVLPLDQNEQYTCLLMTENNRTTALYLWPIENAERYSSFNLSQSYCKVAEEVQIEAQK